MAVYPPKGYHGTVQSIDSSPQMRQSNECSSFAQVKNARSTFGSGPFHNGNGFAMPYTEVTLDNCASISFL